MADLALLYREGIRKDLQGARPQTDPYQIIYITTDKVERFIQSALRE